MHQFMKGYIRQGIDLFHIEEMNILTIVAHNWKLLVQDAIEKLQGIGLMPVRQARALNDNEIEHILRDNM